MWATAQINIVRFAKVCQLGRVETCAQFLHCVRATYTCESREDTHFMGCVLSHIVKQTETAWGKKSFWHREARYVWQSERRWEKVLQDGENRKGCVMSFPYQCLATAILASCPHGLTGICRLTPLPSPCSANTHTNSAVCELCTLVEQTHWTVLAQSPGIPPSLVCG